MKKVILPLMVLPILSYGANLEGEGKEDSSRPQRSFTLTPEPEKESETDFINPAKIIPEVTSQTATVSLDTDATAPIEAQTASTDIVRVLEPPPINIEQLGEDLCREYSRPENLHLFNQRVGQFAKLTDYHNDALKKLHPEVYWTLKIIEGYIAYFEQMVEIQNRSFPIFGGKFKDPSTPDGKEPFDRVLFLSANNYKFTCLNNYFRQIESIDIAGYLESTKRQKTWFENSTIPTIKTTGKRMVFPGATKELFDEIEVLKQEMDLCFRYLTFKYKPIIPHKNIDYTLYSRLYSIGTFSRAIAFLGYYSYGQPKGFEDHIRHTVAKFMRMRKPF